MLEILHNNLVISKLLTRYRKIRVSIPSNFFTKGYLYGDSVSTSSNRFCIVGLMCIINIIIDVVFVLSDVVILALNPLVNLSISLHSFEYRSGIYVEVIWK
jgi:hypothetical protein